jgi:hypothetical protein
MTEEPEEVVTEETEIESETPEEATTNTAEALADAEVEDGDDSDDDEEAPESAALIAGEPLIEGKFTITVGMVIHPSDGHERGQLVTISASSHSKVVPVLISKRMQDLGKMPWLTDVITKVNGNLESLLLEAEKKKQKAAAEKEKAHKAAAAAKAKKDAPKKAKLEKEKKRKEAAKAKAEKKKQDEKVRKEKARIKAQTDKRKAEEKAKADKIKADAKAKADQEKLLKAQPKPKVEVTKAPELKPGEATQPDMFGILFQEKGKKK